MFAGRCRVHRALLQTVYRVIATLNNDRTIRGTDFGSENPDIVKSGTSDRRALLRMRFPRVASLGIDRPMRGTGLGVSIRTMQKMAPPSSVLFFGRRIGVHLRDLRFHREGGWCL